MRSRQPCTGRNGHEKQGGRGYERVVYGPLEGPHRVVVNSPSSTNSVHANHQTPETPHQTPPANMTSDCVDAVLLQQRWGDGRIKFAIKDKVGCFPNMPKEAIRLALREMLKKVEMEYGVSIASLSHIKTRNDVLP